MYGATAHKTLETRFDRVYNVDHLRSAHPLQRTSDLEVTEGYRRKRRMIDDQSLLGNSRSLSSKQPPTNLRMGG